MLIFTNASHAMVSEEVLQTETRPASLLRVSEGVGLLLFSDLLRQLELNQEKVEDWFKALGALDEKRMLSVDRSLSRHLLIENELSIYNTKDEHIYRLLRELGLIRLTKSQETSDLLNCISIDEDKQARKSVVKIKSIHDLLTDCLSEKYEVSMPKIGLFDFRF